MYNVHLYHWVFSLFWFYPKKFHDWIYLLKFSEYLWFQWWCLPYSFNESFLHWATYLWIVHEAFPKSNLNVGVEQNEIQFYFMFTFINLVNRLHWFSTFVDFFVYLMLYSLIMSSFKNISTNKLHWIKL